MKQLLFTYDPPTPQAAKQAAMSRCLGAVTMEWRAEAISAVRELCRRQAEFTADDLPADIRAVREPRAIGALMVKAKAAGLCEPTERMRASTSETCHRRRKAVWKSLVCGS